MRTSHGLALAALLVLVAAVSVKGQGPAVPGATGPQLVQFPGGQSGVTPQPGTIGLLPAAEDRLALYCVDLFNDTPTDRDEYRSVADTRAVVVAAGRQMPLSEALATGILSVRGRDPVGDPPRDNRQWIDLYVRNNTETPVWLTFPAGYTFMPHGRPAPTLAPGLVRMLETASEKRLTGSNTLAYAMWASRGFTREDVEVTQMRPVPDTEVAAVQKLLDSGRIEQHFDRDRGAYARLYATRESGLGEQTQSFAGTAALANGLSVKVIGKRSPTGTAVVTVQPSRSPQTLQYAARVRSWSGEKADLELIHLKTGRPLQMNGGRLVVRLANS